MVQLTKGVARVAGWGQERWLGGQNQDSWLWALRLQGGLVESRWRSFENIQAISLPPGQWCRRDQALGETSYHEIPRLLRQNLIRKTRSHHCLDEPFHRTILCHSQSLAYALSGHRMWWCHGRMSDYPNRCPAHLVVYHSTLEMPSLEKIKFKSMNQICVLILNWEIKKENILSKKKTKDSQLVPCLGFCRRVAQWWNLFVSISVNLYCHLKS